MQVFAADGRFKASFRRADACGIAAGPGGFIVTDGNGAVLALDAAGFRPLAKHALNWDNHLIALERA